MFMLFIMCTCSRVTASGTVTYHSNDNKEGLTTPVNIYDEANDPNVSKNVVQASGSRMVMAL